MNKILALIFLISTFADLSNAKTIVVSDIDDTIKIAHILDLTDMIYYGARTATAFEGFPEVYQGLEKDLGAEFYYVSNAPGFMTGRHTYFVERHQFPAGTYVGRSQYDAANHKLNTIREIVQSQQPSRLILIGDNGENDTIFYNQIKNELANQSIEVLQFIHLVYSKNNAAERGKALEEGQIGFATAVDLLFALKQYQLLVPETFKTAVAAVGSSLLVEHKFDEDEKDQWHFPDYMDCSDLEWQWDDVVGKSHFLQSLKAKIQGRCQP